MARYVLQRTQLAPIYWASATHVDRLTKLPVWLAKACANFAATEAGRSFIATSEICAPGTSRGATRWSNSPERRKWVSGRSTTQAVNSPALGLNRDRYWDGDAPSRRPISTVAASTVARTSQ